MKNKLNLSIALIVLAGFCVKSYAQILWGIKVAPVASVWSESGNLYCGSDYKAGFAAGIQADYNFSKNFSVEAEANYQTKGSKADFTVNQVDEKINRNISYLNIPLKLKANFSDELGLNESWSSFFYTGPYYSILLKAADKYDGKDISELTRIEDTVSDKDMGLIFGIGASKKVKSIAIFTDLRYEMGLYEIYEADKDLRNKSVSIAFGIKL